MTHKERTAYNRSLTYLREDIERRLDIINNNRLSPEDTKLMRAFITGIQHALETLDVPELRKVVDQDNCYGNK